MATYKIGLDEGDRTITNHVFLYEENILIQPNGASVYWAWDTFSGLDAQKQFRLDIRYRGWMRGINSCTAWSSTRQITLDADKCNPTNKNGMVYWRHSMDIGGMYKEISGGMWRYDFRTYDRLDLEIKVTAIHTDGHKQRTGVEQSSLGGQTVIIEYIPMYHLTNMYQETSDIVVLQYETTWERRNDRFHISVLNIIQGGKEVSACTGYWSYIADNGRIEIPTSALTRHIKNQTVRIVVGFNADYRISGDQFDKVSGTFYVKDMSTCNPVFITLQEQNGKLLAYTRQSGSLSAATQATIKLVDGEYAFDERTVKVGETAVFPYCPFNKVLEFETVGSNGFATSEVTRQRHPGIYNNQYRLDDMKTGQYEILRWRDSSDDAGISVTARSNYEVVNLGRSYPTAFFGEGGQKDISYNCVLIDDEGLKLEAMAISGTLMLRAPDTRRYPFAGEVKISRPAPRITKINISGQVVSG